MSAEPQTLAELKAEIERKRTDLESLCRVVASISSDAKVADIRALLALDAKSRKNERDFEDELQKAVAAADQTVADAEKLAIERAVDEPVTKKPRKFIETSDTESDDEEVKRKQTLTDERKQYAAMEYLLVRLEAFTVARAAMCKYELTGIKRRKIVELARVKASESSFDVECFEALLLMHEQMTRLEWNAFVVSTELSSNDVVVTKADAALLADQSVVSDDEDDDVSYVNPFAKDIHVYLDIVSPFSKDVSHIRPETSETKEEYKAAKKAEYVKQLKRIAGSCKKRFRKGKKEIVEIYKVGATAADPILVDVEKEDPVYFKLDLSLDKKKKEKPVAAAAVAAASDVKTAAAVAVPRRIAPVSTVSNNKRKAAAALMCVNHPSVKAYHEDLCATCRFDQVLAKVMSRSAKKSIVAAASPPLLSSSSSAAAAAATC